MVSAAFAAAELSAEERSVLTQWRLPWAGITLGRVLGVGSFGEVWAATLLEEGGGEREKERKPCALKLLHRAVQSNPEAMARFRGEILVMAQLRHRCIARFIGAVWQPPHVALVMELFERGSLEAHLHSRQTRLSWAAPLVRWASDICSGAAYLHGFQVGIGGHRRLPRRCVRHDCCFRLMPPPPTITRITLFPSLTLTPRRTPSSTAT